MSGELVYRVPALAVPDSAQVPALEALLGYAAVRLFVDRARLARPAFHPTERNAPAIARICRRLDGMPLAIELAAARIRSLAPQQIAAHLDDRFEVLGWSGPRTPRRHQTLRAAIDWSHALLSPPEQVLFRRLSVFAASFTLDAAEAVCAGDGLENASVLELLARLVEKSLVLADEGEGQAQYRLLAPMREYAAARLEEAGEVAAVRASHRNFILRAAEEVFLDPEVGGPDVEVWAHRMARMQGDHRAALEWSAAQGEEWMLLRLAAALGFFWIRFAFWQEGRSWLEQVLAATPSGASRERADALYYAGMLAWYSGDRVAAESRLGEALTLFRALGDASDIGVVLNQRAVSAYTQGDYTAAITLLDESIPLLRGQDVREDLAAALYIRGVVARIQGDFELARTLGEESLRLSETASERGPERRPRLKSVLVGDRRRVANVLDSLGVLALYQGDYTEARKRSEASLAIAREVDWKFMTVNALNTLSLVAARTGRQDEAERCAEEALAIARERGMKGGVARALLVVGRVARARRDFARAATCYGEGLSTFMEMRERLGAIQSLERFADLAATRGEWGVAATLFGAAEAAREALGAPLPPADRDELTGALAVLRDGLAPDDLKSAWNAGRQRTLEESAHLVSTLSAPGRHDP